MHELSKSLPGVGVGEAKREREREREREWGRGGGREKVRQKRRKKEKMDWNVSDGAHVFGGQSVSLCFSRCFSPHEHRCKGAAVQGKIAQWGFLFYD